VIVAALPSVCGAVADRSAGDPQDVITKPATRVGSAGEASFFSVNWDSRDAGSRAKFWYCAVFLHQTEGFYMSAKKTARAKPTPKKAKPTPRKKSKSTPKRKAKPARTLGLAISEEEMMELSPKDLEALHLSKAKKAKLRARITYIVPTYQDMKDPFEYAKLEGVPLSRLKAKIMAMGTSPAMNDYELK
jgi:hypothetical protein